MNIDNYLSRIGYTATRSPTLTTLRGILRRHAETIPFENLDVLLGRGVRLDLDSIEEKLVRRGRGGYCFEHNLLLASALRSLGFSGVVPMIARVRWKVPAGVSPPKAHMLVRVEIDGRPWLADAGFGGIGLVEPLALDSLEAQGDPAEPERLAADGRYLIRQLRLSGTWTDVYRFVPEEATPIDFEVGNWFTSTHPSSRFRQNMIVARVDRDRRLSLSNADFAIRFNDGRVEKRTIGSADELVEVLGKQFGLNFPPGTRFGSPGAPWPV